MGFGEKFSKTLIIAVAYILAVSFLVSGSLILKSQLESIEFKTSNTTRMIITENGSVGINTITPDYDFEVNGTARIYDNPWTSVKHDSWKKDNYIVEIFGSSVNIKDGLEIGIDGLPIFGYIDSSSLYVAHCQDYYCSSVQTYTIDSVSNSIQQFDMAIGMYGNPIFGYHADSGTDKDMYAYCYDFDCSGSIYTRELYDATYGQGHSIAVKSDGYAYILAGYGVKAKDCSNYLCSSGSNPFYTLDFSLDPALAIAPNGEKLVTYYNAQFEDEYRGLYYETSGGASVWFENSSGGANSNGRYSSITIGIDGLPIFSYVNYTSNPVYVVHCDDIDCSSYDMNSLSFSGADTRIIIGYDGNPIVLADGGYLGHCHDVKCESHSTYDYGHSTAQSIKIGRDGNPVILFTNSSGTYMLYCGSPNCVPYWGRK